ncbi:MAG: hypothetical protein K9M82_10570 [Deltaproteobacteria bacterium]|nr:hypothetical protein [Deltaproteobacteria bacterium]
MPDGSPAVSLRGLPVTGWRIRSPATDRRIRESAVAVGRGRRRAGEDNR